MVTLNRAPQKIWIGSDHAGFDLKESLRAQLKNFEIIDLGVFNKDSADYSDVVIEAQKELAAAKAQDPESYTGEKYFVILVCGSGQGMAMAANKLFKTERAALCLNTESARLSRAHNDAQILCLGQMWQDANVAAEIVSVFLSQTFEGGRHERRIQKFCHAK